MDNNEKYYNLQEFEEANNLFEDFLSKCKIIKKDKINHNDLKISTMTIVSNICKNINTIVIFQRLKLQNNIVYIESNKIVRGNKKTKKNKKIKKVVTDKRKLSKGSPFSNQISIGFSCNIKEHVHNNPICVKLFQNGRIQITGCKNETEIKTIYNKLYNSLLDIKKEYIYKNQKIYVYPYENLKTHEELVIKSEMINGTFNTNYNIDLTKLFLKITSIYSDKEIYINNEKKSPLTLYLKMFEIYDIKKGKNKIPSVFIYNSGSINLIAINKEIIYKSYNFINNFLNKYYNDITETKIVFNYDYLKQLKLSE